MISRYNILDLLGADKNKYHSCIITCYSFDFHFFEHRVLPMLRRAGILNINLFVDSRMLQQQIDLQDGTYRNSKAYSITPVALNGAFHPKIIMALGKRNGFLAMGSGNLTNSGFSSNDEVWGAFHTFNTDSQATPLFNEVFNFLQPLKSYCYGINKSKWDWILSNTKWLKKIVEDHKITEKIEVDNGDMILLKSFADTSIYKNIVDNLPKIALEELIIISPYYNKTGAIIKHLKEDLNPKTIKVVVDSRYGTVPFEMELTDNVHFYDWQDLEGISDHQSPRLHAKIIQCNYETHSSIIIGSANATTEALGTPSSISKNAEMSLLINAPIKRDWLKEMNIDLPKLGTFDLKSYKPKNEDYESFSSTSYKIKLKHAELDYTLLSIYGEHFSNLTNSHRLVFLMKNDGIARLDLDIDFEEELLKIDLPEDIIKDAFKLYIEDGDGTVCTSQVLIHYKQAILNTNPDERSLRFSELINNIELTDNDLMELFDYVDFKIATPHHLDKNGIAPIQVIKDQDDDREYDIVDQQEFNKNEAIIENKALSNNRRISNLEELLDQMSLKRTLQEDFTDSLERASEESGEGGSDTYYTVESRKKLLSYSQGSRLKYKLHKKLENIFNAIDIVHGTLLEEVLEKTEITRIEIIDDIRKVLVGIHLIIIKSKESYNEERVQFKIKFKQSEDLIAFEKEKSYKFIKMSPKQSDSINEVRYTTDSNFTKDYEHIFLKYPKIELQYMDETPSTVLQHPYFISGSIINKNDISVTTIKGYLINTVSPLLLLILNHKKPFSIEESSRFTVYKKRLFYKSLLLFTSVRWKKKEESLCELFLLNLFKALLPKNANYNEVLTQLLDVRLNLKAHFEADETSTLFFEQQLQAYIDWYDIYQINKSQLIEVIGNEHLHKIIYKSNVGFCRIVTIYNNALNVLTPLGYFDDNHLTHEIKNLLSGKKAIVFK